MLRRDFSCDLNTAPFGIAHNIDCAGRADMRNVNASARVFGKQAIAGNGNIFGNGWATFQAQKCRAFALVHDAAVNKRSFLLMADDNLARVVQIVKRVEKNFRVVVKGAVVTEGNRARRNHVAHFGKLKPFASFGNRADNFYIDDTDLLGTLDHCANKCGIVDGGRRVGHCGNSRKAARNRRL